MTATQTALAATSILAVSNVEVIYNHVILVLKGESLQVPGPVADLLKVLLRLRCEATGVATRLVASSEDIDRLAAGKRDVDCLHGWRAEIFGNDALRLIAGRLALVLRNERIEVIDAA